MRLFATCLLLSLASLGALAARALDHSPGLANAQARSSALRGWGRVPLHFEQNQGQASRSVEYLARGKGYLLGLSAAEATLVLSEGHGSKEPGGKADAATPAVVGLHLLGANRNAPATGRKRLAGKVNYFRGNDPRKWQTDVPTFAQVQYDNVYPGIDLVYYGDQQQLEYDFVVQPGADPEQIRFRFNAGPRPEVSAQGELLIPCGTGVVRQQPPVIYQEQHGQRRPVSGSYRVAANGSVGFDLEGYDARLPLVIDPVLTYSSYLGGTDTEEAVAVAVDADGSCYLGGYTYSADFPTSQALQPAHDAHSDAFLVKLDPTGTALEYATFFGGIESETINALTVAADESVYVVGHSVSPDLPTTVSAFQPGLHSGGWPDAFVAKLSPAGNTLVYATYLGGEGQDGAAGVAVDGAGNAYVVGYTRSVDFPTRNPFTVLESYAQRGFISKLNPQGSALIYSSQLGGATGTYANAVDLDAAGNAYVGGSSGPDFPWVNPIMASNSPDATAFVAKVNPAGSGFSYATPIAASNHLTGLKVDASGSVYGAGSSMLSGYATPNAAQTVRGGYWDGFVFRLNAAGTDVLFATYLGGSENDYLYSLDLDAAGNTYVTGRSASSDFPLASPLQNTFKGGNEGDIVVAKLNATGTSFLYSTYLGAVGNETGWGIAVDAHENAYVVGDTDSFTFPTVRAFQPAFNFGSSDALVFKIGVMLPPDAPTALSATATGQTTIRLDWTDASSNETAFQIERTTGPDATPGAFSRIAQTAAGQTQLTDTGLSPLTTYTYRVRAVNPGGPSAYSNPAAATTLPPPPAPPTNLTAETVSQTQIELHWSDASDNETQFEIERLQGTGEYQVVAQVGAGVTTFADSGLAADTLYIYRVRAINSGGASAYAPGTAAVTLPYPPAAPSALQVTALSATELRLDWIDHSDNEQWFEFELRKPNGSYQFVGAATANEVSVTDGSIRGNGMRTYRMRAVNAGGASDYSNVASGLTFPVAPTSVTLSRLSQSRLDLHWNDPNEAPVAVQIERRTAAGEFDFSTTVAAGSKTYADLGLAAGTEYTYRLRGINATGTSTGFQEVTGRTLLAPPAAPTALTVTTGTSTQLNLHWAIQSGDETRFEVYRQVAGGAFMLVGLPGANAVSFVDPNCLPNTTYTYRVRAVNEGGASDYTPGQSGLTRPASPTNLVLQALTQRRVDVRWTNQNASPAAHRVERQTGEGAYVSLATVAAGTNAFIDTTATPGAVHSYRVWATNASGDSAGFVEAPFLVAGGKLQFPATVNFGKARVGASTTRTVTLKNGSRTEALRIAVGVPSEPYQLSAGGGIVTLAPGAKHILTLVFKPTVRGQAKRTLAIISSDPGKGLVQMRLTGAGK